MKTNSIFTMQYVLTMIVLVTAWWLPLTSMAQSFPEPGNFAQGAISWANNCARCHNMRDPQDLRDDQWITTVFHMRVRAGLTGQQTRDILTFLQDSNNRIHEESVVFEEPGSAVIAQQSGESIYKQTCVACHGSNGKGTVPGAPNFTDPGGPLSQSDEVLFKHINDGFKSKNSPMAMPPKGGNPSLNEQEIQAVLQYLKENFSH